MSSRDFLIWLFQTICILFHGNKKKYKIKAFHKQSFQKRKFNLIFFSWQNKITMKMVNWIFCGKVKTKNALQNIRIKNYAFITIFTDEVPWMPWPLNLYLFHANNFIESLATKTNTIQCKMQPYNTQSIANNNSNFGLMQSIE